jgi:hypothetical protein
MPRKNRADVAQDADERKAVREREQVINHNNRDTTTGGQARFRDEEAKNATSRRLGIHE